MGVFEKSVDPDFRNLDDLYTVLNDRDIILAHGTYDAKQPNPGPHTSIASPNSKKIYDFIKVNGNTFTLKIYNADK